MSDPLRPASRDVTETSPTILDKVSPTSNSVPWPDIGGGDKDLSETVSTSRSELARVIRDLLCNLDLRTDAFDEALRDMEARYGAEVYAELHHLLSHLRFDTAEAKRHWLGVLEHRAEMERRLGAPLDLRVALFSYFVEVEHKITNPKIIELQLFEQTRESALVDELTGLKNYRYFSEQLAAELVRAEQHHAPLSLVMIDVDHFKLYNDRNGHELGNEVLRTVGRLLRGTLRPTDIAARYGGEEFALILPSTPKTEARAVAERAREAVERERFPEAGSQPDGKLTISLGIATYPADAQDATDLAWKADRALYMAKSGGRNRCCIFGGSMRSFRRTHVQMEGRCRVHGEDLPFKTVEMGEGGMSFVARGPLAIGSLLDVSIDLPDSGRKIALSGRVLRARERPDGCCDAALRIIEILPEDRDLLSSLILSASA